MTNQASEDELDAILNRIISQETSIEGGWAGYISDEKEYVESVPYGNELRNQQELKRALQTIIRHEKLKLLAEVRERVVGCTVRVKPVNEVQDERDLIENHHKAIAVNECVYRQLAALTKLEAEL